MDRFAFVMCAGFGLAAAGNFFMFVRIRAGRFYPNPWLGVAWRVTRRNGNVWERAHKAAAPWILRTAIVALLASGLSGIALMVGAEEGPGLWLVWTGAVTGAVAVLTFNFGAVNAALDAADRGPD